MIYRVGAGSASVSRRGLEEAQVQRTRCAWRKHFGRLKAAGGLGEVAGGGVSGVGHPSEFSRTL